MTNGSRRSIMGTAAMGVLAAIVVAIASVGPAHAMLGGASKSKSLDYGDEPDPAIYAAAQASQAAIAYGEHTVMERQAMYKNQMRQGMQLRGQQHEATLPYVETTKPDPKPEEEDHAQRSSSTSMESIPEPEPAMEPVAEPQSQTSPAPEGTEETTDVPTAENTAEPLLSNALTGGTSADDGGVDDSASSQPLYSNGGASSGSTEDGAQDGGGGGGASNDATFETD